ncbi:unnamed protein product [Amoebophrya sp. A120]|nr:unnamed protein product [Amoebophrya sp. A120]|eukprot:GSA120T00023803001.1
MFRALLEQVKTAGRVWLRRGPPGSGLSDSDSESLSSESDVHIDEALVVARWERVGNHAMKRMRRERVSVPSLEVIEGWATLAVRLLRRSLILGEDENEEAKSVALDAKDRSVVLQHPIHFRDATGELLVQGCGPANASPEEYRNEFLYRAKHASSQPVPQECYDMLKSPDHSPLPHVDTDTTVPNNTGALLRYRVVCRFPVHARGGPNQQARERIKADAKLLSAPIDARISSIAVMQGDRFTDHNVQQGARRSPVWKRSSRCSTIRVTER